MLALKHRIVVTRKRGVVLAHPVVGPRQVYVAYQRDQIVSCHVEGLLESWRRPAQLFTPWFATDTRVLMSAPGQRLRVLHATDGRIAWELDLGSLGWVRWKDRLLVLGSAIEVRDLETGEVGQRLPLSENSGAWVSGDLLILLGGRRGKDGLIEDPVLAYDLSRQHQVWKRNLHAELQERHGLGPRDWVFFGDAVEPESPFICWAGDHAVAVSREDGEILWVSSFGQAATRPIRVGETVVGWRYDGEKLANILKGVDVASGVTLYEVGLDDLGADIRAAEKPIGLAAAGSRLVVTTHRGVLGVFDGRTGAVESLQKVKGELGWPVAEGGRVYVPTMQGQVLVFEWAA